MAGTVEYQTLQKCFGKLVAGFMNSYLEVAEELVGREYISPEVVERLRTSHRDPRERAHEFVQIILNLVKTTPQRYHDIFNIIREHEWLNKDVGSILHSTYCELRSHQLPVNHEAQYQGLSLSVSGATSVSQPSPLLELSGKNVCELAEIPFTTSNLKIPNPVITRNLSTNDLEDLQAQIEQLNIAIHRKFLKLVSDLLKSLISQNVSAGVLAHTLISNCKVYENSANSVDLFQNERQQLKAASDVTEVFNIIEPYFSFYNYDIIETIIHVNGTLIDRQNLQTYIRGFSEYCTEVPCIELNQQERESNGQRGRTKICFKLDYDEKRLMAGDVKRIQHNIARLLGIKPSVLHLLRTTKGCLTLEFLVPSFVADYVIQQCRKLMRLLYTEARVKTVDCLLDIHMDIEEEIKNLGASNASNATDTTEAKSEVVSTEVTKKLQKQLENQEEEAKKLQKHLEDKEELLSEFQSRVITLESELHSQQLRAFNAESMVQDMQQSEENALKRAFESESNLSATLQQIQLNKEELEAKFKSRVKQIEVQAKHNAEEEAKEALKKMEMDLEQARKEKNLVERRAMQAEEDLLELRGHWSINKAEIQFTDKVIEIGTSAIVKEATFRGTSVAAKVYSSQITSRYSAYYHQISQEMIATASLRHPNLVQFIGASLEGEFIVVSELMTTSLRKMIANDSITPPQIYSIGHDVICALNYLHLLLPNPIIHKDISSDNILLDPLSSNCWKAKVSNVYSVSTFLALTTSPYTTPYDAPEANIPALYSPKMDIYSFGVVLVEMLTGKYPPSCSREDLIAMVDSINHAQYFSVVQQCLCEDRYSRPSAQDIISQLY